MMKLFLENNFNDPLLTNSRSPKSNLTYSETDGSSKERTGQILKSSLVKQANAWPVKMWCIACPETSEASRTSEDRTDTAVEARNYPQPTSLRSTFTSCSIQF